MRRLICRTWRGERGQALVETVLLFPLILLVVLILVEFGFAFNASITMSNASSEAARYAAVGAAPLGLAACDEASASPAIEEVAVRTSGGMLDCADVLVSYTKRTAGTEYARGDSVTVRIDREYTTVTPLGDFMAAMSFGTFPSTLTLSSCAEARIERGPIDQTGLLPGTSC